MTPEQACERLRMYELWFAGCNTARIAKRMGVPESHIYNTPAKRLFSNMRAEFHRMRADLVRAA